MPGIATFTKYFELKDRHHVAGGSCKFGTLRSYAAAENAEILGARLDCSEGVHRRTFTMHEDALPIRRVRAAGVLMEDCVGGYLNVTDKFIVNDWTYCASVGSYEARHHSLMLSGDAVTGYKGNPRLLSWAVYDSYLFLEAVLHALKSHKEYKAQRGESVLFPKIIEYTDKHSEFSIYGGDFDSEDITDNERYLKAVFEKPKIFSTEREIRFLLRAHAPLCAPLDASPIYLQSEFIKRAILEMGP